MVLSKSNKGKYFTRRWTRDRASAICDKTRWSSSDLDWLEISGSQGEGRDNPTTYQINVEPVDPRDSHTTKEKHDIRTDPLRGGQP